MSAIEATKEAPFQPGPWSVNSCIVIIKHALDQADKYSDAMADIGKGSRDFGKCIDSMAAGKIARIAIGELDQHFEEMMEEVAHTYRRILFLEFRNLLFEVSSSFRDMMSDIKKDNLEEELASVHSEANNFVKKLSDLESEVWNLKDFKGKETR